MLETESASWEHFTATQTDNGVLIKDSGSTNGTFVNGAKLGEDGVEVDDEAVIYAGEWHCLCARSSLKPWHRAQGRFPT